MVSFVAVACAGASGTMGGSGEAAGVAAQKADQNRITLAEIEAADLPNAYELVARLRRPWLRRDPRTGAAVRSEEHTSELQSRENLVCRLLLEKKNVLSSHTNRRV